MEFIILYYMYRLDKVKEYEISNQINSASLHPDQQVFVCGGEDFKMYKCDFTTGAELGIIPCSPSVSTLCDGCVHSNVTVLIHLGFHTVVWAL